MPLFDGVSSTSSTVTRKVVTIRKELVKAKASRVQLISGDANRIGLTIRNDSPVALFLDVDARVAIDDCLVEIGPGGYYEFPFSSTTEVWGLWESDEGQASIRSFIES